MLRNLWEKSDFRRFLLTFQILYDLAIEVLYEPRHIQYESIFLSAINFLNNCHSYWKSKNKK